MSFSHLQLKSVGVDQRQTDRIFSTSPLARFDKGKVLPSGRSVLVLATIIETKTRVIVPDERGADQRFKTEDWEPLVAAGLVEKRVIKNPEKNGPPRFKLDATDAGIQTMAALVPVLRSFCEGGAGKV